MSNPDMTHSHHHADRWSELHPLAEPEPWFSGKGVARGVLAGVATWAVIVGGWAWVMG